MPGRIFWKQVEYVEPYEVRDKELERAPREEAHLISSLCSDGSHMPVLDFDFSVFPVNGERREVRFNILLTKADILQALLGFARYGLITEEEYRRRYQLRNPFSMGEEFDHFHVDFAVPIRVRPSTTFGHYHFFIEEKMSWSNFVGLLQALNIAGLIEDEFYEMSIEEDMAILFLPGQKNEIERIKAD